MAHSLELFPSDLPVAFAFKSPVAERLLLAAEGLGMDGTFYERGPFEQLYIISVYVRDLVNR
jgi:hypothetical protein